MENLREKELEYVYQQGIRYLENRDYIRAKNCFLISKESLIYRKKSINALILIEIYSGNLKMARSLLEEYKDELYYEHTTTYAFLERIEFNLNKGLNIMLDSFKEPSTPNKKLAYLSDFYIEIGEYERARKVLETIKLSHNGTNDLIVRLIFLNIIEGDYLSAYKLFQNIDSNNINSDSYNQLKALIYYHRGILQDEKENVNTYLYYVNRLLNNDEDNLVDHLKRRHVMINQNVQM